MSEYIQTELNNSKKSKLIEIIEDKKAIKTILQFLSLSDIYNFIILNKKIYSLFTGSEYNIINKYLLKTYKGSFLLLDKRKNEIKQLDKIVDSIKHGDKLYKNFYQIMNIIVLIYYSASLTLAFDLFPIALIFQSKISNNNLLIHTPLIIIWILSILILLFNRVMSYCIKKYINKYIDNSINDISKFEKKKLLKNIRRRLRHQKPQGFKNASFLYLLLYTPILGRISFNVKFKEFSLTISILIALYEFCSHLIKFLYFKIKNRISKLEIYKKTFTESNKTNDLLFYNNKKIEIDNQLVIPKMGEKIMAFLFYLTKLFFYLLIIFYIDTILEKVENSDYDIGWNFILIPLDIVGALFAFYWIIFLYSYKSINLKHKWKLYVCIGIITIGILIDIVLLPNFKNKVAMSPFIPIGVNICVTLATIYYFIYLKKMDKKIETDLS